MVERGPGYRINTRKTNGGPKKSRKRKGQLGTGETGPEESNHQTKF